MILKIGNEIITDPSKSEIRLYLSQIISNSSIVLDMDSDSKIKVSWSNLTGLSLIFYDSKLNSYYYSVFPFIPYKTVENSLIRFVINKEKPTSIKLSTSINSPVLTGFKIFFILNTIFSIISIGMALTTSRYEFNHSYLSLFCVLSISISCTIIGTNDFVYREQIRQINDYPYYRGVGAFYIGIIGIIGSLLMIIFRNI